VGTLVVVGTGAEPHADGAGDTVDALSSSARRLVIEADKVLYLVTDRTIERWVRAVSADPESLAQFRLPTLPLSEAYLDMAEWVLSYIRLHLDVVVLIYGHPDPAPAHVITATVADRGYAAVMVPAAPAGTWLRRLT
jgi:hypothetical protein